MQKYFFDISGEIDSPDKVGSELTDVAAALKLACASIGEMLRDAGRAGKPAQYVSTVRDETGTKLFAVTATLVIEMA